LSDNVNAFTLSIQIAPSSILAVIDQSPLS
jgi:hypothetical protein